MCMYVYMYVYVYTLYLVSTWSAYSCPSADLVQIVCEWCLTRVCVHIRVDMHIFTCVCTFVTRNKSHCLAFPKMGKCAFQHQFFANRSVPARKESASWPFWRKVASGRSYRRGGIATDRYDIHLRNTPVSWNRRNWNFQGCAAASVLAPCRRMPMFVFAAARPRLYRASIWSPIFRLWQKFQIANKISDTSAMVVCMFHIIWHGYFAFNFSILCVP